MVLAVLSVKENVPLDDLAADAPIVTAPPAVSAMVTLPLAALAETLAASTLRLPEEPMEPLLLVRLIVFAFKPPVTLVASIPRSDVRLIVPLVVPLTAPPRAKELPEPVATSVTVCPLMLPEVVVTVVEA